MSECVSVCVCKIVGRMRSEGGGEGGKEKVVVDLQLLQLHHTLHVQKYSQLKDTMLLKLRVNAVI